MGIIEIIKVVVEVVVEEEYWVSKNYSTSVIFYQSLTLMVWDFFIGEFRLEWNEQFTKPGVGLTVKVAGLRSAGLE